MTEMVPNKKIFHDDIRCMTMTGRKSVLIVEDDEGLCELLAAIFSSEYVVVDIAKDGKQGLEKVSRYNYDVILSDIDMPVMNGIAFYQQAALHDAHIAERFIFMTGSFLPREH